MGRRKVRSYKIEPELYALAKEKAKKNNITMSNLIRGFVVRYTKATGLRRFFFWG